MVSERSEEHTSELQSLTNLVCRLLLEKKTSSIVSSFSLFNLSRLFFCFTISPSNFSLSSLFRLNPFLFSCVRLFKKEFFFSDTAPTEISTLPLHDFLPI